MTQSLTTQFVAHIISSY